MPTLALLALAVLASAGPAAPELEPAVVAATNARRDLLGLPGLRRDPRLDAAAREHSEDMLRRSKLSHESPLPGKETADKRVSAAGLEWSRVGENLAHYRGYRPKGAEVVADWMGSPAHRKNIVDKGFTLIGVGKACTRSRCYVTQLFAAER